MLNIYFFRLCCTLLQVTTQDSFFYNTSKEMPFKTQLRAQMLHVYPNR